MINFFTEFPIDSSKTVGDVLRLACDSIESSPHSKIQKGALLELPDEGEAEFVQEHERVLVASSRGTGFEIGGVRYVLVEKNALEWAITTVCLKTPDRHFISVRVSCDALSTAIRLPAPRKPYFIGQVIAKLGGGMDGSIPVTDQPFFLNEEEVSVAAALILGTAENRLPIVYVSSDFDGSYIVSPKRLAKKLAGMAHVVVEPSRAFSTKLQYVVDRRNVYFGTVGVYWPESNARKAYYRTEQLTDAEALHSEIFADVRSALAHRRQMTDCSWAHLKEALSKNRYEKLKAAGSTEVDDFIQAFDAEIKAKETKIAEAEDEIARLNSELKKQVLASQARAGSLVRHGNEQDFYDGEIRDIVIDALNDQLRTVAADSRRAHVLLDLIAANTSIGKASKLRDEIKSLFKTSGSLDSKTRTQLNKLGFDVSEDGKHYKAVFHGDGRYTFSISKSASDHRSGKNMASDINKKLF